MLKKNQYLTQPRRMLISNFLLKNGTLITPLFLFYLQQGLVCTNIYRFVEYTPLSCFNSFVQSAVNARREGDKNPNSTVVAETMKLLANSSYGYQIKRQFIRSGNGQSRIRTQRTNYCSLFNSTVRQTENAGTILQFLLRVL